MQKKSKWEGITDITTTNVQMHFLYFVIQNSTHYEILLPQLSLIKYHFATNLVQFSLKNGNSKQNQIFFLFWTKIGPITERSLC